MQRDSQQDQDKVVWQTAAIPLGVAGLDLRTPTSPGALTKLLNTRFRDERTLERRSGYRGLLIQDGQAFGGPNVPGSWIYGAGRISGSSSGPTKGGLGEHFPITGTARGTFRFGDSDVVWTGDSLLIARDQGPFLGEHSLWSRNFSSDSTPRPLGIPAYLPVQTESHPPDVITGDYVEACLTETTRVIVASTSANGLIAWVVDRTTGALIDKSTIHSGSSIREPRVMNSGGIPVCVWRDAGTLYLSWWSGITWSTASAITTADAHDVDVTDDGFYLMWRDTGQMKVGQYTRHNINQSTITFGTVYTVFGHTPSGAFSFAVGPYTGQIVLAFQDSGLYVQWASNAFGDDATVTLLDADVGPYNGGMSVCFRGDRDDATAMVHAGNGDAYVRISEFDIGGVFQTTKRYNCHLGSKSFRVGDEILCWLRSRNSETNFLLAGITGAQVCGIADREDAIVRVVNSGVKAIPLVATDPLDPYVRTWARPFETTRIVNDTAYAELYNRAGNARIGDMNFLPKLSAVQYGDSVYLAGAHPRNWDGIELGDAGFNDYPIVSALTAAGSDGALTAGQTYYFRVYAVRYNKRGERFQSIAITSSGVSVTAGQHVALTIQTMPCTNHDDVRFEVYRTEGGGTTFYLDGTVANSLNAATVTYTSTISDASLNDRQGDPHAPGIGSAAEVEELGPLGCEILCVAGDRLWGAGGQIPAGTVQYSKLKEPGEGAGFDPLNSTQQIDTQGGRITSIAAFGDVRVFFQENGFQVISADGPDNYGSGSFGVPQLVLADGAVNHQGTIAVPIGIAFWGEDGPRLVGSNLQVDQICAPVRELSKNMTPSGVQVDLARQEIVWFTEEGAALLWNFRAVETQFNKLTSLGRWAQWSGLKVAGASQYALVTTEGRLLYEDEEAYGDAGVPFAHEGATGNIAPEEILGGHTHVRGVGVAGEYLGPHDLRLKVFYDGSPMWMDRWIWEPATDTGLQSGIELGDLTAVQIDALSLKDKSGQYATHKRTSRHECRHFRVEWSDISSWRPTCRLHELTVELGARGGFGRVPVSTFRS